MVVNIVDVEWATSKSGCLPITESHICCNQACWARRLQLTPFTYTLPHLRLAWMNVTWRQRWPWPSTLFKGTVLRDFLLLVFFMNQFPPSPRVFHLDRFKFFRKFAEIFASQGAPPVSTTTVANLPPVSATPVANFSIIFASDVDTSGKFSTGVNDAGGKLPPVSTTSVANNGNNIRLQTT